MPSPVMRLGRPVRDLVIVFVRLAVRVRHRPDASRRASARDRDRRRRAPVSHAGPR